MTLTSETVRVQYSGDGGTTAFSITFAFWDDDDPQAVLTNSLGAETTWVRGTQYTISGGDGSTGTLTVTTSPTDYTPASGEKLTITSNLDDTQDTDLPAGGAFPVTSVEQQLDKIVRMIQQKAEAIGRALKLPVSSTVTDIEIPDPSASKFLRWDASAANLENADINATSLGIPVPLADGGTNADLSSPTALSIPRINAGATAVELRTVAQTADALAAGAHTIFIPAAAMRPTVSNGCAEITDVETTAGRPDMQVLDFDTSSDEAAQFSIAFPSSWDFGTISFRGFWTTAGAVTTGIALALQGVAVANDGTLDVAYGTAVVITDDALGAAEDLMVTAESSAVTIAGSPAAGELCYFRLFRDVSDGNDDMTQDMRLLGIQMIYTVDEAFDT
jgi:hypothetical protein